MTKDETWVLEEKYGGDSEAEGFAQDCHRLAKGEPVAYVIGHQPFLGLTIHLDSKPLIPRPETEWWVNELLTSLSTKGELEVLPEERAQRDGAANSPSLRSESGATLEALRSATARAGGNFSAEKYSVLQSRSAHSPSTLDALQVPPEERAQCDGASKSKFSAENYAAPKAAPVVRQTSTFLDLCAGSGAIGCAALSALPYMEVYFGEIDPAHEATIRKNIHGALSHTSSEGTMIYHSGSAKKERADVRIGDLFAPFGTKRFDVIAVNPPYIPSGRVLDASVRDFEPGTALFSGADGLSLMRRIAEELPSHLNTDGVAWIECDRYTCDEARGLFEAAGLVATVLPDQYGAPRVVVVSFP